MRFALNSYLQYINYLWGECIMSKTQSRKSNRNGTIYYDNSRNRWISEIHWTDRNGEFRRKRFSGKKQIEVKNKIEEFKKQLIISNGNIEKMDLTLQEFAENWMNTVLKNKLKPSSYNRKEITLSNQVYPHLGHIPMNEITHQDVQMMVNFLNESGLSYSSIKKAYDAVNQIFKYYRIKSSAYFNPCEGVALPETKKMQIDDIKFFNDDQRKTIQDEALKMYSNGKPKYRLGNAIILLMYSGMRAGELIALTWNDVNFDDRIISINKNAVMVKGSDNKYKLTNQKSTKTVSGNRMVPMTRMAEASLRELEKVGNGSTFVINTKDGRQVTPRTLNKTFHRILINSGIAKNEDECCGVHSLRHTFASMLFKNGCSVKVVSELLGHSDTRITENIYIHLIQEQKVKAILDIDKFSN